MNKTVLLYFNKQVGKPKAKVTFNNIKLILHKHNISTISIFETKDFNDEIFLSFDQEIPIIIFGGDGTIHVVINFIINNYYSFLPKICFLPIPLGTGNDWLRTLGLSKDPILQRLSSSAITTDVLALHFENNKICYSNNIAGFGFDSAVCSDSNKLKKTWRGLSYMLAVFKNVFFYKTPLVKLKFDEFDFSSEIFVCTLAKGKFFGNGMYINPLADCYDGFIDVIIIKKLNPWQILWHMPKLFKGTHIHIKDVLHYKTKEILVEFQSSCLVESEGEVLGTGLKKVVCVPQLVRWK